MANQVQYRYDSLPVTDIDKISLPKYQRGLVWNKKKKQDFIQTLHEGFPFGTFLVYEDSNDEGVKEYILIDGQQRLSTLKQYLDDKFGYWRDFNSERFLSCLNAVSEIIDVPDFSENVFIDILNKEDCYYELQKIARAKGNYEKASEQMDDLYRICKEIKHEANQYVDTKHLKLPVIVFNGNKSDLPKVFANLNKGGTPLNKYEIWGAAWVTNTINLPRNLDLCDEILDEVKTYYDQKQDSSEFEIIGLSIDELYEQRSINLSELGFALGRVIQKKLPSLGGNTEALANELGFGVLGIATGVHNKELEKLAEEKNFQKINNELPDILQKVKEVCHTLSRVFNPLLLVKKASESSNEYATGLNATYKTLSYFSALWSLKPGTQNYIDTTGNIPKYYLYHALLGIWGGHGDQTLYKYYPGEKTAKSDYLTALDENELFNALITRVNQTEPCINFTGDVKAIVTIHANLTYLAADLHQGEDFELEHIIAKKHIDAAEQNQNSRQIKGGVIGNCMWLPKNLNLRKKDKNLHEVNESDQKKYSYLLEGSRYSTVDDFSQIEKYLKDECYEQLNDFISNREVCIMEDLVDALYKKKSSQE